MKKISKKVKILLGITTFLAIIVALIILYLNNYSSRTDRILFQYSYTNYAWAPTSRGYYIYSNGIIKEYDDYNEDKELKSAQITKEELEQLKELANKVEDKYEREESAWCDAGTSTKQIYSTRLSKWIMLSFDNRPLFHGFFHRNFFTISCKVIDYLI